MSMRSNIALLAAFAAAFVATAAAPASAAESVWVCGVRTDLNVRAWPGTEAPVLHRVSPGEELLETGDHFDDWSQVVTPFGAGYVNHRYICH